VTILARVTGITASVIAAVVIVLLLVNPARDLTLICALLAIAVVLWRVSVAWRLLVKGGSVP
jgi:hypothetical protein